MQQKTRTLGIFPALALALGACGGDDGSGGGPGNVRITVSPEDTITDGLTPGPDVENTKDYGVSYSKFIVAIGDVKLGRSGTHTERTSDAVYLVDLTQVSEQGVQIAEFNEVPSGQWDAFAFETPASGPDVQVLEVSAADAATMIEQGLTYWIEGTVARPQTQGGSVDFVIQTAVPTLFDHCGIDGEPGLAVVEHQTATGVITIHGDHIWFNSFPTGSEGAVERRSAWLVEADKDGDGKVETADLAALDATEVFTTQLGYRLDGAPAGIVIDTALDFVRAQLATQGHFKGEGECLPYFEGESGQ